MLIVQRLVRKHLTAKPQDETTYCVMYKDQIQYTPYLLMHALYRHEDEFKK